LLLERSDTLPYERDALHDKLDLLVRLLLMRLVLVEHQFHLLSEDGMVLLYGLAHNLEVLVLFRLELIGLVLDGRDRRRCEFEYLILVLSQPNQQMLLQLLEHYLEIRSN
jgi:hypothetical protein